MARENVAFKFAVTCGRTMSSRYLSEVASEEMLKKQLNCLVASLIKAVLLSSDIQEAMLIQN